jgi:hypothetical protein
MSELVLTVVAGPAHRNNGSIRNTHCLLTLYAGGSGAWVAHNLQSGRSATVRSQGHVDLELVALTGLFGDLPDVATTAAARNHSEPTREIVFTPAEWQALHEAAETSRVEVAIVVSGDDPMLLQGAARALTDLGWSALVCGPLIDARHSQWGRAASEAAP